jgi:hypothetical protein
MKRFSKFSSALLGIVIFGAALAACGDENVVVNPGATATQATTTAIATTTSATTTSVVTTVATTSVATVTPVPATTARPATTVPATTAPATTAAPTKAPTSSVPAQAIRKTNWLEVLKADPALQTEDGIDPNQKVPYFAVKSKQNSGDGVGGYPLLDNILYVDMDGDGVEEAAITFYSGGTAGNIGFVVYKYATPAPRFVDAASGYKLLLLIQQGKLVAKNALYGPFDPNCCPAGFSYTTYVLKNNTLSTVAERSEGMAGAEPYAVEHFYNLLDQKQYSEAYKLLSPASQKANPYDKWVAGFATTKNIEVETSAEPGATNLVHINLTSTDVVSGKEVTKQFTGTWKVTWDTNLKYWQLSEANIKEKK